MTGFCLCLRRHRSQKNMVKQHATELKTPYGIGKSGGRVGAPCSVPNPGRFRVRFIKIGSIWAPGWLSWLSDCLRLSPPGVPGIFLLSEAKNGVAGRGCCSTYIHKYIYLR